MIKTVDPIVSGNYSSGGSRFAARHCSKGKETETSGGQLCHNSSVDPVIRQPEQVRIGECGDSGKWKGQ